MKKLLILSLIFAFSFSLAGCTQKTDSPTETQSQEQVQEKENSEQPKTIDELDVSAQDLQNLKAEIQSIQTEDLTTLSQ